MPKKSKEVKRAKIAIGRKADGTAVYKYFSYTSQRDKEKKREEIRRKYSAADAPERKEGVMFEDLAEAWLEGKRKKSDGTYDIYERAMRLYLLPEFGGMPVSAITKKQVQAFADELGRTKSENYCDSIMGAFRQVIGDALDDDIITKRPDRKLELSGAEAKQKRMLTEEETAAIIKSGEMDLLLLYYTGMRIGEVCGLEWRDIDFDKRTLTVKRQMNKQGEDADTKTDRSKRTVPIPAPLYAVLVANRGIGSKKVVERSRERIARRLDRLCPGLTPHYLRHNYCSVCFHAGVDLVTCAKWLGDSIQVMQAVYMHLSDGIEKQNAERLDAAFVAM